MSGVEYTTGSSDGWVTPNTVAWDEINVANPDGSRYCEVILTGGTLGTHLVIPTDLKMRLVDIEDAVAAAHRVYRPWVRRHDRQIKLLTALAIVQLVLNILILAILGG